MLPVAVVYRLHHSHKSWERLRQFLLIVVPMVQPRTQSEPRVGRVRSPLLPSLVSALVTSTHESQSATTAARKRQKVMKRSQNAFSLFPREWSIVSAPHRSLMGDRVTAVRFQHFLYRVKSLVRPDLNSPGTFLKHGRTVASEQAWKIQYIEFDRLQLRASRDRSDRLPNRHREAGISFTYSNLQCAYLEPWTAGDADS